MLAIERRNEILEKLQNDRRVVVSELSQIYEVSEETIRRDLDKLVQDGFAIKSYGGAVINENVNIELPFNIRKNRNIVGKQHIAELVSEQIKDGDSIMLDASSTAVYVAKTLLEQGKKNLTVLTNSVEIIIELFGAQDWKVLSTGGESREGSFALVGYQTDRMLRSYHGTNRRSIRTGPVGAGHAPPVREAAVVPPMRCAAPFPLLRCPDVSLRGAKRRGNLGKALPVRTRCR